MIRTKGFARYLAGTKNVKPILIAVIVGILSVCAGAARGQVADQRGNEVFSEVFLGAGPEQWRSTHNANAADTTNADQLWSGGGLGLNLTGAGVTVGIWDGGAVRSTHQEFANGSRVTVVDAVANSNHSTHVAGTIGAQGTNASAIGMAGSVLIRSRDFSNDYSEMASDAGLIDISNHSYGLVLGWTTGLDWGIGPVDTWVGDRSLFAVESSDFGKYTAATKELDTVLHNNPKLLSVWSAGNDRDNVFLDTSGFNDYVTWLSSGGSGSGWYLVVNSGATTAPPGDGNGGTGFDSLAQDQVAKNTLVVGSVLDHTVDPHNGAAVTTNSFSSYGPTDDGRMKPDVVANGNALTSSFATNDTAYGGMSGTSMSAPNATGTAALLVEHYRTLNGGQTADSATTKGIIIHTATDAGNTGPDYSYGWGLIDGAAAANFMTSAVGVNPSDWIHEESYSGSEWTVSLYSDGTNPLKATLAWTDPAPSTLPGTGLDDTTSVLVNDLDLWITDLASGTYYPWTLDWSNPANAAVQTTANHLDNVEQVLLNTPLAGWYQIHVGRTGATFDQDFSLLVSGVVPEPATLSLLVMGGLVLVRRRRKK